MKSVKLSKLIKEDIIVSMVKAWSDNNRLNFNFQAEESIVANLLWQDSYKKLNFSDIPLPILKMGSEVKISIGSEIKVFYSLVELPIPKKGTWSTCVIKTYNKAPKIVEKFYKLEEQHKDWLSSRSSFKEEVTQIVYSVNTTKQLVELWPEAEQYLPAFANDPSEGINLPALKTSRLNSALGIKP